LIESKSLFEIFVTVDDLNASNLLSSKWHISGLKIHPATLHISFLVIPNCWLFLLTVGYAYICLLDQKSVVNKTL